MALRASKELHRREVLAALGAGVGAAAMAACGSSSPTAATTNPTTTTTTVPPTTTAACAVTPSETRGPYPDTTGMINNQAFYRRDITEGKSGLPLTLTLTVVNTNSGCSAISNVQVEIWQCDASGNYSEYAQPGFNGAGQTFLRGVQTTDAAGRVTFTTVFPGWYQGRATHIHVEVKVNNVAVKVTQIAFEESVIAAVYATGVYASKGRNPTSNASDMVFADSLSSELATITGGDTTNGYTASFTVGING